MRRASDLRHTRNTTAPIMAPSCRQIESLKQFGEFVEILRICRIFCGWGAHKRGVGDAAPYDDGLV